MIPEALEITRKFMSKPVRILVKPDEMSLEGIKQFYVNVEKEEWKLETVCDLYETLAIWHHSIYSKEWLLLSQIRGSIIVFRDQIHKELGHTIDLSSL